MKVPLGHSKGFTIVELVIVVAVIGILALVVIVSYGGITRNALEVSMKSDLQNIASEIALEHKKSNAYPTTLTGVNITQGSEYSYFLKSYGYCVSITNPKANKVFRVKSSNTSNIEEGACDTLVSTVAGTGVAGHMDGTGDIAQFRSPNGLAIDTEGNLYVADSTNHRIRKVTPDGTVSTFAGSGTAGYTNANGAAAQFNNPRDVAFDTLGNLYVADSLNGRIRKVTPDGTVSTFAGSGVMGYLNGNGVSAQLNSPRSITVSPSGMIYVIEGNRIRKITPSADVTLLAGSGTAGYANGAGAAAQFGSSAEGIAADTLGNVYVSDYSNNRIRKITPGGTVSTFAGDGTNGYQDGVGEAAKFNRPSGLAINTSNILYLSDYSNNRIRKVTPDGTVSTIAGTGVSGYLDGAALAAQLRAPSGILIDTSQVVYFSDFNKYIRKIQE